MATSDYSKKAVTYVANAVWIRDGDGNIKPLIFPDPVEIKADESPAKLSVLRSMLEASPPTITVTLHFNASPALLALLHGYRSPVAWLLRHRFKHFSIN